MIPIKPQYASMFTNFDDGSVRKMINDPIAPRRISHIRAGVAKNPNRSGSK